MKLRVELNHDELNGLQFPIVVEMWDKKSGGRVRRAWLAEFNEAERKKAGKWYILFYDWHLRRGTPQTHNMSLADVDFIHRLVNFFGAI